VITRRDIVKALVALGLGGTTFGGYAFAESFSGCVTRYALTPPRWPAGLKLRLAVIADLHVCEPWMSPERVRGIVEQTNMLGADAILLLGDYVVGHQLARYSTRVKAPEWAKILASLKAPLGVHAVLGNHDWWDEYAVQVRRRGPTRAGVALEASGIPVYENKTVRLIKDGQAFWLAGLGDQWAFWLRDDVTERERDSRPFIGVDDLPATLAQISGDDPVILMAHEPDIFPDVPDRVSLTVSGHTHGGQLRVFGYSPIVPSRFKNRYAYGHVVEGGRNLIVSGGLGCSGYPIRFGVPPEIVVIELGSDGSA